MALVAASSLSALAPGQGDLAAERMKVIERVSKRPQTRVMDGQRANLTLRGVPPRGTGSTVQFFVAGVPVSNITAIPVDLKGMTVQRPSIPVHAINTSSEAENPGNMDLLKDYALRCVRREAGMQAAFRF